MKAWTGMGLALAALAMAANAQTIQVSKENRTIAITATDKVIAQADTAVVHVGFVVYGQDSDSAYANGSRISNGIVKTLTSAGVAADAIESENQSVNPVPQYELQKLTPAEKAQRQFQLTQSWSVRTRAADAAKVLDVAVKAGANQSGQIEWHLKDENALQAEAAAKALQRARTVAEQMAQGMNVRLGALIYASNETQAEPVRPLIRGLAGMAASMSTAKPLAIHPREIEKTATVYAVFAIE